MAVRHLAWISYQMGANQAYNLKMTSEQQESLRDGIRFLLDNPSATPIDNHKNWLKHKLKQGWRYGPTKSTIKKTHPDMVSFQKLPATEGFKDVLDILAHKTAVELWKLLNDKVRDK